MISKITRRDFINATLMVAAAIVGPLGCTSETAMGKIDPLYYPPVLTGLGEVTQDQIPTPKTVLGIRNRIGEKLPNQKKRTT